MFSNDQNEGHYKSLLLLFKDCNLLNRTLKKNDVNNLYVIVDALFL